MICPKCKTDLGDFDIAHACFTGAVQHLPFPTVETCEKAERDALQARVKALEARVKALEARLEISPAHSYDAVDTRNATIKALEEKLFAKRPSKPNENDCRKAFTAEDDYRHVKIGPLGPVSVHYRHFRNGFYCGFYTATEKNENECPRIS